MVTRLWQMIGPNLAAAFIVFIETSFYHVSADTAPIGMVKTFAQGRRPNIKLRKIWLDQFL